MSSQIFSEAFVIITITIIGSMIVAAFNSHTQFLIQSYGESLRRIEENLRTEIKIIFANGEINGTEVKIWVKNVGERLISIPLIEKSSLFFGKVNCLNLIPLNSGHDYWVYTFYDEDDDGFWGPGETLEIDINLSEPLDAGDYMIRFVLYNGDTCDYIFSI